MEQESWQKSPEQENTAFATSATLSALEEEEILSDHDRAASTAGRFNDAELELTTISILQNAAEANMVKNQLEAAGIRAYLSGEEAVAMAWYLGDALGGIKVQVAARDAEDALDLLEQKPWQESPEEDNTAFATSATLSALEDEDGPEEVLSNREKTAMMAGRSAVFGLVFWPLELYALYLLFGVWSSSEKLEGRGGHSGQAGVLDCHTCCVLYSCRTCCVLYGPFFDDVRTVSNQCLQTLGNYKTTMTALTYHKAHKHLSRRDHVLKTLIGQVGPCTLEVNPDGFAVLARSIISQQISTKAAHAIGGRLLKTLGRSGFRPRAVLKLSDEAMRAAGLSAMKVRSLRDLAEKCLARDVPLAKLPEMPDEEVIETLLPVRGIGRWTAEMFLIFSLGRLDVLPMGDYGLRAGIRNQYGLTDMPDKATLVRIGEVWRPYRSVGTWFIWRSFGSVIQSAK